MTPKTPRATGSSPAARLPLEVVEIITAHLIYETDSLFACSLTCYSWYIATIPHLHHTLITTTYGFDTDEKFVWPGPLQDMHKFGLLPLIKKFHVRGKDYQVNGFSPRLFDYQIMRHWFPSLTNVQELGIDYLNIPEFMSTIPRYFGHFLPTVRSLALREPKGSRRQIIYFIGLFQHLEDLKLLYDHLDSQDDLDPQDEPPDDLTLVPSFAPPLQGQLTMVCFTRVELLKDMIVLFEGIRFHRMDLCNVAGMGLLLSACAETLETLRLYPTDPRGEGFSPEDTARVMTNAFAARTSLQDFDLSRNESLRTLEVLVSSVLEGEPKFFPYVLPTITPLAAPKIVIVYRDYDFPGLKTQWDGKSWYLRPGRSAPWLFSDEWDEASWHPWWFGMFRQLREIRKFRLELCVDVWGGLGEYAIQQLRQAVAVEKVERGFDDIFPEPLLSYSPRRSHRQYWLEILRAGSSYPWIPL